MRRHPIRGAPPTPRQAAVLEVITRSLAERGYAPTYAEIGRELGIKKQRVAHHICALRERGALREREYRSPRALAVSAAQAVGWREITYLDAAGRCRRALYRDVAPPGDAEVGS